MTDPTWKKNLWDYLSMGIGFWVLKDAKTPAEKLGVLFIAIAVVVFVVFS